MGKNKTVVKIEILIPFEKRVLSTVKGTLGDSATVIT